MEQIQVLNSRWTFPLACIVVSHLHSRVNIQAPLLNLFNQLFSWAALSVSDKIHPKKQTRTFSSIVSHHEISYLTTNKLCQDKIHVHYTCWQINVVHIASAKTLKRPFRLNQISATRLYVIIQNLEGQAFTTKCFFALMRDFIQLITGFKWNCWTRYMEIYRDLKANSHFSVHVAHDTKIMAKKVCFFSSSSDFNYWSNTINSSVLLFWLLKQ